MENDATQLVTIRTFDNYIAAHLAKERLEQQGIPAYLKDELTITMNWLWNNALGGIKLQVLETNVAKANAIIEADEAAFEEQQDQNAFEKEDKSAFDPNNKICIYCGSKNTKPAGYNKSWAYAAILFLGFPIAKKTDKWHCFHCLKDF